MYGIIIRIILGKVLKKIIYIYIILYYIILNYIILNFSDINSRNFYRQKSPKYIRGYSIYPRYNYTNINRRSNDNRNFFSRPVSPVLGSEEYMLKKIEQTSANIMKHLLNPNEQFFECRDQSYKANGECSTSTWTKNETDESSSLSGNNCNKGKTKKNAIYSIDEIHEKIMNHITKLKDGKKKNLINSNVSGYDAVIEQIQKQKRLEISQALRAMFSQSKETKESSDFISSVIPDIGIKIEDLPHDLIEELRNTLNVDSGWNSDHLLCNNVNNGEFSSGMYLSKLVFKN